MINNLVEVLEKQKYPIPPPAASCIGSGSVNRLIIGTSDPDTLIGTSNNDDIRGLEGDDLINGCGGNDRINGGADNDGIAGGPQNDDLIGYGGDDIIRGDAGNDRIAGGPGTNVLTGGPGRDLFICSPESATTITDFVRGTDNFSGPCILSAPTATITPTADDSSTSSPLLLPLSIPVEKGGE